MTAMRLGFAALLTAFLGLAVGSAQADDPLETALRQVVQQSAVSYQKEDVAGFMQYVHTKSPEYATTRDRLTKQFADLDVTATVTDFRLIGHDDEFAVARMKLKTTSTTPGFADNVVDQLVLFHQENGVWKYWGDSEIGVEVLPKK
jgi:hypothetical protein